MARIRIVQEPAKAMLPIMVAAALATALTIARPTPALAAPALVPGIQVGAQPPHQAITNLPAATMPPAHQVPGQCAFEYDPLNPPAVPIKHIAPCGNPMTGTGAPDKPWGTIAQAVASLAPGDVAYVHDDPARAVDYSEYNLTPAHGGTGAPCPPGGMSPPLRIRLMAAPGEGQPTVAKPPNATLSVVC